MYVCLDCWVVSLQQEKLFAAQNDVVVTSQCVQESESRLKEIVQHQRQLEEQRVEVYTSPIFQLCVYICLFSF